MPVSLPLYFYLPPDEVRAGGYGVASDFRVSVHRLSVFRSRKDFSNPWGYFFHIAHIHLLRGVDVPFGVYELWLTI